MEIQEPLIKMLIPTFSTLEVVNLEDIIAIHADDNYSQVELAQNEKISSTKSLGKFAEELASEHFFQCHKSHLINLSKMVRFHKNGHAEMENGTMVPVARRRKDEFLEQVGQQLSKI